MGFENLVLSLFSAFGLVDGSLAALLFRRKHFYLYSALGTAIGFGAAKFFLWYALGYDRLNANSLYLAYFLCGTMAAAVMMAAPLLLLSVLSFFRRLKRLAQALGALAMAISLGIGVFGAYDGNTREEVEHFDIYMENLPAAFEGYRFVQVTDTHIGPYFRWKDLAGELDRAKAEDVDAVFFTGDLIDDIRYMPETADILTEKEKLFKDGILYVWGNHEYYRGKDYIEDELRRTPVKLLVNENFALTRGGETLYIAGVDYPWGKGEKQKEEILSMAASAYEGIPAGAPTILLAHHPDFFDEGFRRGTPLILSGHTHGTQVGIFGRALFTPFTYTRGMYTDGTHQGYVSRGDASWFPFRFGCPREMAVFTLHGRSDQ